MTSRLILLRHGESAWNHANFFCGWIDVGLSERGVAEARRAGGLLRDHATLPDIVHTSVLRRTIHTANIALDVADRLWIPVRRSWRLNERHYGLLQGQNKKEVRERYGPEQFMQWRRSYDVPPPAIDETAAAQQQADPRYRGVTVPRTECLRDVVDRMAPYWRDSLTPDLTDGRTVLVSTHGSVIRALIVMLDSVPPSEIVHVNVPTGVPLMYELDEYHRPLLPGGVYLDPHAAAAGIAEVAAQGT